MVDQSTGGCVQINKGHRFNRSRARDAGIRALPSTQKRTVSLCTPGASAFAAAVSHAEASSRVLKKYLLVRKEPQTEHQFRHSGEAWTGNFQAGRRNLGLFPTY